jgi:hypothetical protein
MHRSRLGGIIIDCEGDDLDAATTFWSQALGYPPGEASAQDAGRYRSLQAPPQEVQVELQKVDHPSRVHIDIETDDLEAEVARLLELGAVEVARVRDWCVLQAPSGHRLCVVKPQRKDFEQSANTWE